MPGLPLALKPFQRALTAWALRRGRAAIFAGTGLGKTLMQLAWARAVADHEDAPILALTPLAVAEQTVAEAAKFGIEGVRYAPDQRSVCGAITISNYERFEKFRISEFAGIVLDESGILKSQDGKTRAMLTEACSSMRWRLCCTATPAPNDYTELGQHAEFLGVLSAAEMLAMFFVHDGAIRAGAASAEWRLKRHAEQDFWRWLASWGAVVRSPQDLGFDEAGYDLPPLLIEQISVAAPYAPTAGLLFPVEASSLSERISVRRETAGDRVAAAVRIVETEPEEPWLIWCNLNSEADAIERALPDCRQVAGADPVDTVASELEGAVVANLRRKEADYERMLDAMSGHMRDLVRMNITGAQPRKSPDRPFPMELPAWL
jgi:hypothetical protein